MTAKQVFWTPGNNNSGQYVEYKSVSDSTWTSSPFLSSMTSSYLITSVNNDLIDVRVKSICNSVARYGLTIQTFLTAGLDWSFISQLGAITVNWNFAKISSHTAIKISVYEGLVLVNSQTFAPSNIGTYTFIGLKTNQLFTVVNGLTFNTQSFPENPYTIGGLAYLTPTQTLTEYKRATLIATL